MSKKAHICIGGPLNGEFATTDDFEGKWRPVDERGMYSHLVDQYLQYNGVGVARHKAASMVWLHRDLAKPAISPSKR